ncbi:hypothetical protein PTSG_10922 [Salpingoeca rosetta]|uniref:DUF4062 domain-containing protein n=1 Tax=Salpingoeca rosetta (strain ATCC 50818 / BSB-021) TaxID=946362 RepID=F2URE3_SALR5|nr:uncharacterized protein PTSG_10922 [Salpingoeca rosetta]EGD80246.1 hypothetical protein PTSG_10922 [Salpingoeca rosetta]|eukprot:XP_004988308.1 hypothetical protein PTSG_10922 [Salpingoeca rosetta]
MAQRENANNPFAVTAAAAEGGDGDGDGGGEGIDGLADVFHVAFDPFAAALDLHAKQDAAERSSQPSTSATTEATTPTTSASTSSSHASYTADGNWSWAQQHFASGSRVIRAFFSSPFGGMEDERTTLTKLYFPELRAMCEAEGLTFVPIDLRWGITERDAQDARVLQLCLKEIDRCDMFVGFYAARYGWHNTGSDELLTRNFDIAIKEYPWIEAFKDKSVTEIEFEAGHFQCPGEKASCFFFRASEHDSAKHAALTAAGDTTNARKFSAESAQAAAMRDELKKRVVASASTLRLPCHAYSTPEEGARLMYETVKSILAPRVTLARQANRLKHGDSEAAQHDVYMKLRSDMFLGYENYLDAITQYVNSESTTPLVVTGRHGTGKTSLLARWLRSHMEGARKDNVTQSSSKDSKGGPTPSSASGDLLFVYHFVGCSSKSTTLVNLLQRLVQQFSSLIGDDVDAFEFDITQLKSKLASFMARAARAHSDRRIVVLLDALDELLAEHNAHDLSWLPSLLPSNVAVIVSTVDASLAREHQWSNLHITDLSPDLISRIMHIQLQIRGKSLSERQQARILDHPACHTPLFLIVLIAELCAFGSFEELDDKIEACLRSENVEALFMHVLQRLDDDFVGVLAGNGDGAVRAVMTHLACARHGLSEAEIMDCLELTPQTWSRLYFAMEDLLVTRSGLLLRACITHPRLFADLCAGLSAGNYDLLHYWAAVGDTGEQMADAYMKSLDAQLSAAENDDDLTEIATAATRIGQYLAEAGHFKHAVKPFQQALKLKERVYGRESEKVVDTLADLGRLCFTQGDAKSSHALYTRALKIARKCFDADDLSVINIEIGYASVLKQQEDFDAALQLYKHALKVYSSVLSPEHLDVALVHHNIGDVLARTGHEEEAVESYQIARDIRQRALGASHPATVSTLVGLGSVLLATGQVEEAQACFKTALEVRTRVLGRNHPETAEALGKAALIEALTGTIDDAMNMFMEAITILEESFGPNHPALCEYLDRMAELAQEGGHAEDALHFYTRSLSIKEVALGSDSPALCDTLYNIAQLSMEANHLQEAYVNIKRVYDIAKVSFGPEHPLTQEAGEKTQLLSQLV